jgi:hypothetical protein
MNELSEIALETFMQMNATHKWYSEVSRLWEKSRWAEVIFKSQPNYDYISSLEVSFLLKSKWSLTYSQDLFSRYGNLISSKVTPWSSLFQKMAFDFLEYTTSHQIDPLNRLIGRIPSQLALKFLKIDDFSIEENPKSKKTENDDLKSKRRSMYDSDTFFRKKTYGRSEGRTHLKWNLLNETSELQNYILRWASLSSHSSRVMDEIFEVASNIRHVCPHRKGELVAISLDSLPLNLR